MSLQMSYEQWRGVERTLQGEVEALKQDGRGAYPWFLRLSLRYAKVRAAKLAAVIARERAAAEDEDTVICSCPFEAETVDMRIP